MPNLGRFLGLLGLAVLAVSNHGPTFAGPQAEVVFKDDELLQKQFQEVLVVKVTAVVDPKANTYGNPPLLKLQVARVLKGKTEVGSIEARWMPPPSNNDTPTPKQTEEWLAWSLSPPAVGSEWIVAGFEKAAPFGVSTRCRFPLTPENLKRVEDILNKAK